MIVNIQDIRTGKNAEDEEDDEMPWIDTTVADDKINWKNLMEAAGKKEDTCPFGFKYGEEINQHDECEKCDSVNYRHCEGIMLKKRGGTQ